MNCLPGVAQEVYGESNKTEGDSGRIIFIKVTLERYFGAKDLLRAIFLVVSEDNRPRVGKNAKNPGKGKSK